MRRAVWTSCIVTVASLVLVARESRAAVVITPEQVVVQGPGGGAVIARSPLQITFTDANGRAVLRQVANERPSPVALPQTVDPELGGVQVTPSPALYSPFFFEVGVESSVQWHQLFYVGNMQQSVRGGAVFAALSVVSATPVGEGVRLEVSTNDPAGRRLIVDVQPDLGQTLRVTAAVQPSAGVITVGDAFQSTADEAFHGFGGRHTGVDQRARRFYSWAEQENFGGGPIPQLAFLYPPGALSDPHYMFPNGPMAAYYPQNLFISSKPYGFLVNRDELTRWRLATDRPDAWQVAVSAAVLDYTVAPGDGRAAIGAITNIAGRERLPPAWGHAPILSRPVQVQSTPPETPASYTAKVVDDLGTIEHLATRGRLGVGSYAFEGWPVLDPAFRQDVVARLRVLGLHPILYVRSYVSKDSLLTQDPGWFDEAVFLGLVTTNADGTPFFYSTTVPPQDLTPAAVIDFTNPAAVAWFEAKVDAMLDLGADGFMLDFGEQSTDDMHFANGETGATMHNRYPVLYAQITRDIVTRYEASHPQREKILFYPRSGFSGRPGTSAYVSATFPGDETSDWTVSSGIGSLIPDMLNRGLGGAYGFQTDIGGYADFTSGGVSKELFIRWTQLASLTPYMRVHNSTATGPRMPWSFDAETLELWNRSTLLHSIATPYMRKVWERADATGMPVMRPLWLQFPGDATAAKQDQEFMLGDDLLVAPVVTQGATRRDVYFPAGLWLDIESQTLHVGGKTESVDAPLGKLPYFVRLGGLAHTMFEAARASGQ